MRAPGPHPRETAILAFLDGELGPLDADAVRNHCSDCEQCRQVLQELSVVSRALQSLPPAEPVRPVWPAVRDGLERARLPIFRPAFAAATTATALLGVLLGVWIGSIGSRATEPSGSYLWSYVASSITEEGGDSLPDIYSTATSREGR
jgi:anti-sigma factor RsiW